jgi:polysaccharide biosynthesis/export protein
MSIRSRMMRFTWLGAFVMLAALVWVSARAQQLPDYTVNAGDELDISVWKEQELTKTIVIRPDGKFSFPLAGEINAVGRTMAQIQNDLAAKLKVYIPEPVVTASLHSMDGYRVYVIGQVTKPGAITMNPRLNVLQALTMAGGFTPFAGLNDIIILRGSGSANQRVLNFRYGDVSHGKSLQQNVPLEAGDVIVVP